MDNTNFRGRERSNNLAGHSLQPPISQNPHRTPSNLNNLTHIIENSTLKVSPVATEGGSRQSSKEPQLNIYYADSNKNQADNKRYIKGEFRYTTKGDQAAQHRGFEGRSHPRGFKCQTTAQHGLPHVLRQTSTIGKFTKLRDEQEMMRHSIENEKQLDDEANPSAPLKENNSLANGRRGRAGLVINQEFVKGTFQYTTKGGYAAYHRGFEGRCNPRGFKCQTTAQRSTLNIIRQDAPVGTFVKMTDEQQMMRQSFEEHHQHDFDPPKVETNPNPFSSTSLVQNNNLLNAQPRIQEPKIEQKPIKNEPPQIKNNQVLPQPIIKQPQYNEPIPLIPKEPEKESSIYTFEAGLAANNQKMIQNIFDSQSNQIKENLSNIPGIKPLPNHSNVSNKSHSLPPINPSMVQPKFYENHDEDDIPVPIPNRKSKNQTLPNTILIPNDPLKQKQQEADSPDTSFILTEFKKELMKVEPTLASTENQDSIFRNSNHISQILGTAPNKNHPLFSSYSTVAPRDKSFKGMMNMEIERLNSDDSDAANDPTILEFRDALDKAIEMSKVHHRRERSTFNPRPAHTKPQDTKRNMTPQTHTRDTSLISTGNFIGRDSNSTSFILPSGKQQYQDQDQRVNQTMMYDAGDSYDGEWDLNKRYQEAMQAKWKSQRDLQGQGGGALNQIKAVDSRSNKGHKRDILDYLK